jgi:RNA polymerase sigma factor (sigma-70 family)
MISVDILAQYRRDVRALREQVQEADPTPQHLVETNLPLVITLARRYEARGVDLMDLIQEGNLGLLHAVRKYDPSLGAKFSTYAVFWIKEAIQAALAQRMVAVSASKHTYDRLQRLLRLQREMQEKTGQVPTLAELAREMDTSVATVLALLNLHQGDGAASLDAQTGEHEEDTLASLLEADPEQGPEHLAFLHHRNEHLQRLLLLLTKAERTVILLRYGLCDGEAHPYEGIATRMHVSSKKVHSLEQRALLKLRRFATLKHMHDFLD